MSTLNPTKKVSRRQELRQDTVVTFYAKVWAFYDQHKPLVLLGGVVVVVMVLAFIGYLFYQNQQDTETLTLMSGAVSLYEQGQYRVALDGEGETMGLLTIIDDYGQTPAGNLARFYAGDAQYRLGAYEEALSHFQAFKKEENFIGASALAGEAAIYENQEDFERAGDRYQQAALFFKNEITSPQYLINAGRAFEQAGVYGKAQEAYMLLSEQYPSSSQARNIDLYLARVTAKQQKGS